MGASCNSNTSRYSQASGSYGVTTTRDYRLTYTPPYNNDYNTNNHQSNLAKYYWP